jgi:hypothetical protein
MADRVRKVSYSYVTVPARPGQGAKVLEAVAKAGINMAGCLGFPAKAGTAQLDIMVENVAPLKRVAKRNGWRLAQAKKCFLIQGPDRVGAVHRHIKKLGDAGINVTAATAVTAGRGRYGMVIWVKPRDYARAAQALGAK